MNRIALAALGCLLFVLAGAQPLFARVIVVQKDQVNVRQGAGTATTVIGKAGKGVIFGYRGSEADWTRIAFSGEKMGYIRNDLLLGYDEAAVTGASVRVRQAPSLRGAVIGSAKKGDKLLVLDYQQDWYEIQYGQSVGWISADYIKLGEPVNLSKPPADTPNGELNPQDGNGFNFDSVTVSTGAPGGVLNGVVITLDPGHGTAVEGKPADPGAESATLGIWEKDVNLDVALKLRGILEGLGATVWMTHTGETSLDLYGRAEVANQNGSCLFISIHANSSENPALNGHSVYYYAPTANPKLGSQRSARQALARSVQNSLTRYCERTDLGIKENNFAVLRETNCPSILIETAFLSNAHEELMLAQGAFRQRLAEAIAAGIASYLNVG